MNLIVVQQVALDNALVAPEKRLKIEKCNARIEFSKPQREATYQVTLDALKLSPCYPTFLITAEVPEIYMHQFWNTIKKIKDTDACQIGSIFPGARLLWCISGKSTGLDRLRPSRAQILWGMFYQKNVDYVALLWEDIMFQADNRDISTSRKENMPYPRFTKVIINHFISKDKTISIRNMINLHTIRDDSLLGTLKFVSKTEDYQKYGAQIPKEMINQDIKDSKAYKTYLDFAIGKATPKKARKFKKIASPSKKLSFVLEEEPAKKRKQAKKPAKKSTTVPTAGVVIRDTPGVSVSKKKSPAKVDRGKGMDLLSEASLLEAAQLKKALKKSKQDTHILHASGSCDGVGSKPKVPDASQDKKTGTNEETDNDDDSNDDDSDDDVESNADGDNEASDSERTDEDEDE
ncbi:hypothetical protein Tco_1130699, partial [Tanacetum coccineum]